MQAAAPQALLSQTSKTQKAKSAKTASLTASAKKGTTPFWRLMSGKTLNGKTTAGAAAETKRLAAAASEAASAKLSKGAQKLSIAVKEPVQNPEKQAARKDEKTTNARKAARANVAPTEVPAQLATLRLDTPKKTAAAEAPEQDASQKTSAAERVAKSAAQHSAEPIVRVVDLRKKSAAGATDASPSAAKPSTTSPSERDAASFAQRLTQGRAATAEPSARPASSGAAQQQTPLERLREMAGSDLVKATNILLKDGGGELRLVLKPESLGSVRIRMNIVDNAIEGKIIVDNSAVRDVFNGSIDALKRAFTAEGFQTASLSVSVGGQNTDAQDRRQQQEEASAAAVRRVEARDGFQRNIPGVENLAMSDLLVNLFV